MTRPIPGTRFKAIPSEGYGDQIFVVLNETMPDTAMFVGPGWVPAIMEQLFTGNLDLKENDIFHIDEIGEIVG